MAFKEDRDLVRRLASDVSEIAQDPVQGERGRGWRQVNSLQEHRPMLWITEIPWGELEGKLPELTPVCRDQRLRNVEREMRRLIFKYRNFPCDEVCDGVFYVSKVIEDMGYGVQVSEKTLPQQGGTSIQSHHYESVIKEPEDIEKIRIPAVVYNQQKTHEKRDFFEDVFGDIMDVRVCGPRAHWFNAWDLLVRWTGVNQALTDLVLRPDFIHAVMRRMADSYLTRMERLEQQGLLGYPHPCARIGSGGAGYTDELPRADYDPEKIRTIDQWGGATAQIFSEVSPAMHEEFALKYEMEVMERCGLNYYGCFEPLENKMELLARVPRLRKVSIGPWCDVEESAANASETYVFSHKPSPAILAEDKFDATRAEKEMIDRISRSNGMPCEFIMKDISTVRGDVERVIKWCEMAHRIVKEY